MLNVIVIVKRGFFCFGLAASNRTFSELLNLSTKKMQYSSAYHSAFLHLSSSSSSTACQRHSAHTSDRHGDRFCARRYAKAGLGYNDETSFSMVRISPYQSWTARSPLSILWQAEYAGP